MPTTLPFRTAIGIGYGNRDLRFFRDGSSGEAIVVDDIPSTWYITPNIKVVGVGPQNERLYLKLNLLISTYHPIGGIGVDDHETRLRKIIDQYSYAFGIATSIEIGNTHIYDFPIVYF